MSAATAPSAEQTPTEPKPRAGFHDLETAGAGWNLRLLRTGAALLTGFELLYLIADYFVPPPLTIAASALHAAAVGLTLCVFALSFSRWFERYWRPVCLANLFAIYGLTVALQALTGDIGPFSITVTLTLIGTGALLPWSAGWQAGLSVIALAMAVTSELMRRPIDGETVYRLLGVVLAIVMGHFILAMHARYRGEVGEWIDRLRASHRELADALAESAATMAERERAGRRLRESEAMLRTVFDAIPDNLAITRMSDGVTLEVNRQFLETGYTREEVVGVSALKLGRWSRSQLRKLVRELRTHGKVRNFEAELRTRDGRMVPNLVAATIAEIGGQQCVISIAHDISARKRAERELSAAREALAVELRELELNRRQLADSENKLRKVLEATGEAITLNRFSDGCYLDVNPAFSEATGYAHEAALGHSALELGVWHDPDQLRHLLRLLKTEGRVHNLGCRFRRKDGGLVDHLVSASLIELDGETCIVAASRDVSDLKRIEREMTAAREELSTRVAELSETQMRLRAEMARRELAQQREQRSERSRSGIFEAALDAITIKRARDGRYIEVNDAFAVYGYTREEALGKTAEELGIWADPAQLAAFTEKIKREGRTGNFETLCRTRDGKTIPSLISAVTVELDGEPCVVSFVRDISALKRTEHELIAARKAALAGSEAKSQFLSVMSHEIRTPMNAIFGMAELLWETPLTGEQRLYLETMRNNSTSLLNLIDGILDLSKVESGRLNLEYADFDLAELAEDVMETMALRAHEKGLELALRIPCKLPTAVNGDPLRLRQILINLLGNAIKFTDRGEVTLTIEQAEGAQPGAPGRQEKPAPATGESAAVSTFPGTTVRRQALRFIVCDTGIGIPADRQEAIFASFTQADSTISRRHGGSGLGLAIVKRLVELMNGSVAVESRPGAGSAFGFTVALALQPGASAEASASSAYMGRLGGRRLLVVDGSPTSRVVLAELLEHTGAEVSMAIDGGAALSEIKRARGVGRPYDAIVADRLVLKPGETGLARDFLGAPHAPGEALVLLLTANDLNAQVERLRACGFEQSPRRRYLLKPVRRAQLWATLAAACDAAAGGRADLNGAQDNDAYAAPVHPTAPRDTFIEQRSRARAAAVIDRPLRILLAEDSTDNRFVVQAYLKSTPYRLDHAENGAIAVQKFAAGHYDAILMDIQMPVLNGYEAAAAIRRLEREDRRRPTPIIALTASAHEEAIRRSLQMGFDAHVTKPVKRSTLLEAIRDTVEPAAQNGSPDASAAGENTGDDAAACAERSATGPITVQIDEDLADLVPGFLSRKSEDARAVLAAAERSDAEAIAQLGHKMKGEGGSYGLDAVTDIGRGLEQAGHDRDFAAAARLSRELANFLERLEIVYRPAEE